MGSEQTGILLRAFKRSALTAMQRDYHRQLIGTLRCREVSAHVRGLHLGKDDVIVPQTQPQFVGSKHRAIAFQPDEYRSILQVLQRGFGTLIRIPRPEQSTRIHLFISARKRHLSIRVHHAIGASRELCPCTKQHRASGTSLCSKRIQPDPFTGFQTNNLNAGRFPSQNRIARANNKLSIRAKRRKADTEKQNEPVKGANHSFD